MSVEDFYLELKKDVRNNEKIISLATSINLNERYSKVDALTLAIYYQHRSAFHTLLDRGIDIQPKYYKEIPPILWSLEISDTYYFEKLINHKKTDIFIKTNTKGENILSNMCLKLNDIWLFKKVFIQMKRKDSNTFNELLHRNVYINTYEGISPIILCLKYLNENFNNITQSEIEHIALEKIKIILDYEGSLDYYCSFNTNYFLKYLFEKTDICINNPDFMSKCLLYLSKFKNYQKFVNLYSNYFKTSIKFRIKSLFDLGIKNDKFKKSEIYFQKAIQCNNLEYLKVLEENDFSYLPEKSFNICIDNDNLDIFKYLLSISKFNGIFKYSKFKNNRFLHQAIMFSSYNIFRYLTTEYGDDMDYKGVSDMTPREFLEYCYQENYINQESYKIMNVKSLNYKQILKLDKHNQTNCCICLDELDKEDICILNCGHIFHTKCALTNLSINNNCPMCRQVSTIKYVSQNDRFTENKQKFKQKMEIIEREILIEEVRQILLKSNINKKKTLYINDGNIPSTPIQHLSYRNALIHNTC